MIGPRPDAAPTIVMLHEGLGCVGLWGRFPGQLAAATGAGVFVYSRAGYGRSSPVKLPRPLTFMHEEALRRAAARARCDRLPPRHSARPQRRRLDRGDLCRQRAGPSRARPRADGAAFLHRGHGHRRDRAAPRSAFEPAICAQKLARWHADVDNAFHTWSGPWLDPEFRKWDITEALAYIRVPILIVQGEDDQYGTMRQIEVAQQECYCPVEVALSAGRAPCAAPRSAGGDAAAAVAEFVNRLLRDHHEGELRRSGLQPSA